MADDCLARHSEKTKGVERVELGAHMGARVSAVVPWPVVPLAG